MSQFSKVNCRAARAEQYGWLSFSMRHSKLWKYPQKGTIAYLVVLLDKLGCYPTGIRHGLMNNICVSEGIWIQAISPILTSEGADAMSTLFAESTDSGAARPK